MFTGFIKEVGTICDVAHTGNSLRIGIQHSFNDLFVGESIAVNGICLTVCEINAAVFYCDISPETVQLTAAPHFKNGMMVNLERSLRPLDRMGGHFVSGHVDQVVLLTAMQTTDDFVAMTFSGVATTARKFLVKKGSIAINGVSLTINELTVDGFQVMLIPHTLQQTSLSNLKIDDVVNIEFDLLAKLVANQLVILSNAKDLS